MDESMLLIVCLPHIDMPSHHLRASRPLLGQQVHVLAQVRRCKCTLDPWSPTPGPAALQTVAPIGAKFAVASAARPGGEPSCSTRFPCSTCQPTQSNKRIGQPVRANAKMECPALRFASLGLRFESFGFGTPGLPGPWLQLWT